MSSVICPFCKENSLVNDKETIVCSICGVEFALILARNGHSLGVG